MALKQIVASRRVVAFYLGADGTWAGHAEQGEQDPVSVTDRALLDWFKHNPLVAYRHQVDDAPPPAVRARFEPLMEHHRIDALLPIVYRRSLLAVLGIQLPGRPSEEERAVIHCFWAAANAACARPRLLREVRRQQLLNQDVQRVATVRRGMTPAAGSATSGDLDWSGKSCAADEASGDFWSVYRPDIDSLLVVVGDTQRAGVGGALIAAAIQSCCETLVDALGARSTPELLLATINRMLWRPLRPALVTCVAVLVEAGNQQLRWCNAGHLLPSLMSGGELAALQGADGPVLGENPNSVYRAGRRPFGPGDALFLPSAGLIGTQNREGHAFGARRFVRLLADLPAADATACRDAILGAVAEFRGSCRQRQDESLVVIRNRAEAAAPVARGVEEEGRLRLDPSGVVIEADNAAIELLRGSREQIVGRSIEALIGCPLTVADLSGRVLWRTLRRLDQSELVAGFSGSIQRGRGGEPLGVACTLRPSAGSAVAPDQGVDNPWELRFAAAAELVDELMPQITAAEQGVGFLREAFDIMLEVRARCRQLMDQRGSHRLRDGVRAIEEELDWPYLGTAIPQAIDAVSEAVSRARAAATALLDVHRLNVAGGDADRSHLAAAICGLALTHLDRVDDDTYLLMGGSRELDQLCRLYRQLLSEVVEGDAGGSVRRQLNDAEAEADIGYLEPNIPRTFDRLNERLGSIARAAGSVLILTGTGGATAQVPLGREVTSAVELARLFYQQPPDIEVALDADATSDVPAVPGACARAVLLLLLHGIHQIAACPGRSGARLAVSAERREGAVEIRVTDPWGSVAAAGWTLDGELEGRALPHPCSAAGQGLAEVGRLIGGGLDGRLAYQEASGESSFVLAVRSSAATSVTSSSGSSPAV